MEKKLPKKKKQQTNSKINTIRQLKQIQLNMKKSMLKCNGEFEMKIKSV